jgi:VWFA-related protein
MSRLWTCFALGCLGIVSRLVSVGLLVSLCAPAGHAQSALATTPPTSESASRSSAPADQPSAQPPSSAHADEVSLDLIVRTRKKKPVLDLKPSDLAITDDGSPVTLTGLHLVTAASAPDRLITLLFDRLDPSSARAARNLAARILRVVPNEGYSIAVLQMGGRLRLFQAFTADRGLINAAIDAATPINANASTAGLTPAEANLFSIVESDSLSVDSAQRAHARLLRAGLEDSQRLVEDEHTYPSLAALEALAQSQRQISGRKFVFWFSEGMRADSDTRDAIRSVIAEGNRAGLTICAVDSNSIDQQAGSQIQAAMAMSLIGVGGAIGSNNVNGVAGGGGGGGFTPGAELNAASGRNTSELQFGGMDADQSPLARLATDTGGIYIRASSGAKHQLQQLQNDLTSYYEASYILPQQEYDGAFHPIAIRSMRKGLIVRSRAGYFAVPPDDHADFLPWEAPLLQTLAGGQLPSAIAFRTSLLHLGPLPDGNTTELTVEVPVSELQVREDANTHISSAHAAILALIKDSKGVVLRHFSKDFPLHESPDVLRKDPDQTVTMQDHFSAEPGVYTLETVVFDALGNQAGAQRTAFTIDPPSAGPSLSDVVLVRRVDPVHDETAAFDPMRYQHVRIVPRIDSELPEDTRTVSLFVLVHPVAGSTTQPRLQLRISRNHEILSSLPIELQPVSGTGAAIPYYGKLEAGVFPPGKYQAEAVLTQDGQTGTSSLSFSVEGTIAASMAPATSFTATSDALDLSADRRRASSDATRNSLFVIATPSNPVPAPSAAEVEEIVDAARGRALSWFDSLENFFCIETTSHSVDLTGSGDWKHKDTLVELIRYVDHHESRTTLQLNGEPSSTPADQLGFAWSVGEFGAMFHILFDPSAHARFAWKESDRLDGQPVQVFTFQVALRNSTFNLSDRNNHQSPVGFYGLLYLDTATHSVRRITIEADDIPPTLAIRASSISVDYAWISINHHDYLLPVRGAVSLHETKHIPVLNEFQFRDYRRFGSQIRMLNKEESENIPRN